MQLTDFRVGFGHDSHRFSSDKPLILGGVLFEGKGLEGNSDCDVILHALCNALASSIGKGSLSTYADELCKKGIFDSKEYVKVANGYVKDAGYKVNNVAVSVETKNPKLEHKIPNMKKKISTLLNIDESAIGITATSGEELTPFGKGKGIQANAIVSICK
jgi:2-C-methyl-D-erythritol 2,4-cyclodiphosphate synthase